MAAIYLGLTASTPAETELIVPFFKAVAYPLGIFGFMTWRLWPFLGGLVR